MNSPGPYSENRRFEWTSATCMIAIAISLTIFSASTLGGAFGVLYAAGLNQKMVIALFAAVGLLRVAALWANGGWHPYGPWLRFFGATMGTIMWSVLFTSLLKVYFTTGVAYAAALATYSVLACAELDAGYRAIKDARQSRSVQ